ncbi:hypothetical protein Moror_3080 [Moniliophthora roreri MCA 2997]|uniref:Uncharacterized protein n=2 Tax=Moniliophthora roreri TaxID=221103 RepID=V2YAE1_MONRO|nr:hypothetical protein Moror_3080 [Moniliophthora roreri MCA 2997]KAI3605801.1 hypothetical protein WG66_012362 [Moniliophthora roreri]
MYTLSLDRAALLLIPPQSELGTSEPCAVQIMVKSRYKIGSEIKCNGSPDILAAYFFVQNDITKAVRNLVAYDLTASFPFPYERKVIIKGDGYALHGAKHPWSIFQHVNGSLRWGNERVRVAKHKWVFELELERELWKEMDWEVDETLVVRSDELEDEGEVEEMLVG